MKATLSICYILFCFTVTAQLASIDSIITRESLQYSVSVLANDSMKGRFTGMPETKIAANFIATRFDTAGLKPLAGYDAYFEHYPIKFKSGNEVTVVYAINVIGALKGIDNQDTIVIFCAHYDHIGVQSRVLPGDTDSIFNGANDNASGIALLIELAKYYAHIKINKYTLVFIAFSGEELGLLGSAYTAAGVDQSRIHAVINIDMVGRPIDSYTKKCMVIADKSRPVIKELNAQLLPRKNFFIADMYPEEFLFSRSDHYSFKEVKNRIFFTASSPRDKYYHTVKDEFNTIDFEFLLSTAKNIALGCKTYIK